MAESASVSGGVLGALLCAGLLVQGCSTGGSDAPGYVADPSADGDGQGGSPLEREGTESPILVVDDPAGSRTGGAGGEGGGVPQQLCGNGTVDDAESCDDGNAAPGDGCSGRCEIESGFACPDPGHPCELLVVCGDGKIGHGERCDDNNTEASDGCSPNCSSIDPGFVCPPEGGACSEQPEACGNALLEPSEECDDANAIDGDGCTPQCVVETGYVCPAPGSLCRLIDFCGDGNTSFTSSELCDDGNSVTGDGCSDLCRIEPGWVCTGTPSICEYDVVCGDGRIRGAESCDDGNDAAGDGCDASCTLESGWVCPTPGAACRGVCGDGNAVGREECDDGDVNDEDGCSATCQEEPGWTCPPSAECRPTVCGDGVKEGSESCDDGNLVPFDGCGTNCISEPRCGTEDEPRGACSSECGDGILVAASGEACDDGNSLNGDGCSSTCTVEEGFDCLSFYDDPPQILAIPIIYRDFSGEHPDFGTSCCDTVTGIVESLLGSDRKPVYAGTDEAPMNTTSGATGFDQWYRDVEGTNQTFYESLTLVRREGGTYSMDSTVDEPWASRGGFYPLEEEVLDPETGEVVTEYWGFGNEWLSHNYLFTSELRYWFEYQGGERLDFSGDDDVWVFVNGRLAVDLGGVHGRLEGGVTLTLGDDGETNEEYGLTTGRIYEIAIFQAERWCCESNYWVTLSNFVAGRSTCEPMCGDGIVTANEACDLGTDGTGISLNTGEYGGCTSDCQLAPFCGDGSINGGEACDDGTNAVPYDAERLACAPGCTPPGYCGDGVLDTAYGEVCDAGASNAADAYGPSACTDTCQVAPYCGDGLRNGAEECDEGASNGSVGSDCSLDCRIKCGNGSLDGGEECDLGEALNTGEYDGCTSECTFGPHCGDGARNGPETCDDGLNDGRYGTCLPDCTVGLYCGDGRVDGPEQCDLGDVNLDSAYGSGLCTTQCLDAPHCGDGVVQESEEECDGGSDCEPDCSLSPVT